MRNLPTRNDQGWAHYHRLGTQQKPSYSRKSRPYLQQLWRRIRFGTEVNEALRSQAHAEWERGITLAMLNFAA